MSFPPSSPNPNDPRPIQLYPGANGWTPQPYRPPIPERKPRIWLHVALFLATVAATTMAVSVRYSACLLLILTCHEFGHYFAAKYHRVKASLPYFIPSPFLFGTFGAVIRMSPYIPNRRALFDIAAAGPLAGLIVAVPVSFIGMWTSELQSVQSLGDSYLALGDPLFFQAMQWIVFGAAPEGSEVMLNDVGFAGWVGIFVTALNLLPIGQLDGGHVVHAVFGRYSRYVAMTAFGILALATFAGGYSYMLFLVLLWFMGVQHPPTMNDALELGPARRRIAWLLLVVFILCFTPTPLRVAGT